MPYSRHREYSPLPNRAKDLNITPLGIFDIVYKFLEVDPNKRLPGLDFIRAFAIILVLYYHSDYRTYSLLPTKLANMLHWTGFLGVDLFFVLSGFLIGSVFIRADKNNPDRTKAVKLFMLRRWRRTLPNYYYSLAIHLIIAFCLMHFSFGPGLECYWIFKWEQLPWKYFVFLQYAFPPYQGFFQQSWSLCVEELAYVLLAIAAIVFKLRRNYIRFFLSLFLVAVGLKVVFLILNSNINHTFIFYRLHSIFAGLLFSALYSTYEEQIKSRSGVFFAIGVFLFGVAALAHYLWEWNARQTIYSVMIALVLNTSFVLILPMASSSRIKHNLWRKTVTLISVLSYSLYLNHFIVLLSLDILDKFIALDIISFYTLYLSMVICIALLQYRFIELPFLRTKKALMPETAARSKTAEPVI